MATVRDILAEKGSQIVSIGKDADVLQAAVLMNDHKIGALVVTDAGNVVGMFTERDVMRRVVVERRDPARTFVREVMTTDVVCCTPDTDLDEARGVFRNRRIRHLPVVTPEGRLLGLISIGDLNAYHADTQERTIHFLHAYLYDARP